MHQYAEDFYGEELRVVLLGYTRPECDFSSLGASQTCTTAHAHAPPHTHHRTRANSQLMADALIEAINEDIAWTSRTLDRPEHTAYPSHSFFSSAASTSSSS